ncbi:plant UBX domain-containing protein 8-like [Apium graveolens]|uniref:plant UBX domain-containing protein 8-like n=1 Tax=Apium graveolens TaxID=4045 RepID=UPI003D7AB6D9
MARPDQEAIDLFMSITGASEPIAVQKLVEYAGNLNQAVNAHFSEGDRNITQITSITEDQDDLMDIDDPIRDESHRPSFPALPSRTINPFPLLDSDLSRSAFDGGLDISSTGHLVSRRREVRQIPVVVKDGTEQSSHSSLAPAGENSTGTANRQGSEFHDTVIIDDDDDENILPAPVTGVAPSYAQVASSGPSAPMMNDLPDYRNDIEEEMVQAAIEASKRDSEFSYSGQNTSVPAVRQSVGEDPELAHAVSLSLKTAEQERAVTNLEERVGPSDLETPKSSEMEDLGKLANGRLEVGGSSTQDEVEDIEDHPLVRNRSRRMSSGSVDSGTEIRDTGGSPPLSPQHDTGSDHPQHNETDSGLEEWGGISSLEHDEAVMLEAALFGGIPEGSSYHVPYAPHQYMQNGFDGIGTYTRREPRPPSPSLTAQRLIREQQDDEYLASLQADREKELKAREEAEARLIEEQAAREAALEVERQRAEELQRKLQEEQEMERQLAAKEACLPNEPSSDDENVVTFLVRMPDGSRRGRRFLKSHKLQYLFDYIDVGRQVKPGTYRLVRPYPRRAYGDGECSVTFNELGLTSRQEALFLELI